MKRIIKRTFYSSIIICFALVLHLQKALAQATCALPGPSAITVTNLTPTGATVAWSSVPGAASYRVAVADLTSNSMLPDSYTSGTSINLSNLQTETHAYSIRISASACPNGPYGAPESIPLTPPIIIIVDDVFQKNLGSMASVDPQNNMYPISLSTNASMPDILDVKHYKVTYNAYFVEFIIWADCENKIRYQEIAKSKLTRLPGASGPTSSIYYSMSMNSIMTEFFSITEGSCSGNGCSATMKLKPGCQVEEGDGTIENTKATCGGGNGNSNQHLKGISNTHNYSSGEFASENRPGEKERVVFEKAIQVTPNPFSDQFTVQFFAAGKNKASLTLIDATGHTIRTIHLDLDEDSSERRIDVFTSDLPDGIYFLMLQTNEKSETTRLIKVTR